MGSLQRLAVALLAAPFCIGAVNAEPPVRPAEAQRPAGMNVRIALRDISVDRVIAYLLPLATNLAPDLIMVHDSRMEQGHMPSTLYAFAKAADGGWTVERVVALVPYGWAGNYGGLQWQEQRPAFVCEVSTATVPVAARQALDAVQALEWRRTAKIDGRYCSHCREIGFRKGSPETRESMHFVFFNPRADGPLWEPAENEPAFAALAALFPSGQRDLCVGESAASSRIARNVELEGEFTQRVQSMRVANGFEEIPQEYLSQ